MHIYVDNKVYGFFYIEICGEKIGVIMVCVSR